MSRCSQFPPITAKISPDFLAELLETFDKNQDGDISGIDAYMIEKKGWRSRYRSQEQKHYFQKYRDTFDVIRMLYLGGSVEKVRDIYKKYR